MAPAHGFDDEAIEAYGKVLQLDPTYPGVHLRLAEIFHIRRDVSLTRRHLRAEMLLRPQDSRLLMDLSNLLADTGQSRGAVACLKRLVEIEPKNVSGWQNLAVAQFAMGRYDDGIASSRSALVVDPANTMVIYNLSLAHVHLGRYTEARVWARRGLRLDPEDISLQRLDLRTRILWIYGAVTGFARRLFRAEP